MKITKIETFKSWVDWCNWLLVRISTDDGITGWGEASLHGAIDCVETAIHEFGSHLIGQDPAGPERHWHRLYNAWRWRGGAVFMTALAGLDLALWDLEGKRLGVPVHRLLGGAHRDRLRVYASHWIGSSDTPEQAFSAAKEAPVGSRSRSRSRTLASWPSFNATCARRPQPRSERPGALWR